MNWVRQLAWLAPVALYIVFWLWYSPIGGKVSDEEIEALIAKAQQAGFDENYTERLRVFLENDDGRSFIMANLIELDSAPETLPATGHGATASKLMSHYMEYMYPALLSRACHPAFVARAASDSLDIHGIADAESWDNIVMMRYRSRRDLVKVTMHPSFFDRHEYKLAAINKTIAIPASPTLLLGDLRVMVGLFMLGIAGAVNILVARIFA